ncbi:MAG: PIN domain-containing protein [Tannerella sp.]|jgi:predicted nucleic acid-binding protein|nr:PIN domain-containing protein [Tannerella sp.]
MEKLLIDTNIIIDLLAKRAGFYLDAQQIFTSAEKKNIELNISSLTFANTYYILSRYLNATETRKTMIKFKALTNVLPLDDKIIELALVSDYTDFEDAIQYYTAIENQLDIIITRNKKDFRMSGIPVLSPKEYIALQIL